MRRGVMRSRHSAPRHRLDMHRQERLDGDRTLGLAQRRRAPATTQETLLAQEFRRFPGAIGAFQGLQPANERPFGKTVRAAISGSAEAAAPPRLDVNRPHCRLALFSKCFDATGDPPLSEGTRYAATATPQTPCRDRTLTTERPATCDNLRHSTMRNKETAAAGLNAVVGGNAQIRSLPCTSRTLGVAWYYKCDATPRSSFGVVKSLQHPLLQRSVHLNAGEVQAHRTSRCCDGLGTEELAQDPPSTARPARPSTIRWPSTDQLCSGGHRPNSHHCECNRRVGLRSGERWTVSPRASLFQHRRKRPITNRSER